MRRLRTLLLYTGAFLLAAVPASGGPLRQIFPKELLLYAEVQNGRGLYEAFVGSAGWRALTQEPTYARLMAGPDLQRFQAGRRHVGALTGTDPVELLLQALGRTAAGGVWPLAEGGLAYGIVGLPDKGIETAFRRLSELAAYNEKNRSYTKDGCEVIAFEKGAAALGAGMLALASDEGLAVELASAPGSAGRDRTEPGAPGFDLILDLKELRGLQGRPDGPPDPKEPFGILLAGGWTRILRSATELRAHGALGERGLRLEASLDSGTADLDEPLRPLYAPASAEAAEAASDGQIASVSLARDLGLWWRERRSLFPAQHRAKLAEAENVLNAFFSGPIDEVLAGLAPRLTLLIAPQSYPEDAAPKLPLPAFALQAKMTRPEAVGQRFLTAFQSGVVLSNMDRAQKGQGEPLALEVPAAADGMRLVHARFPRPAQDASDAGEGLRYNLSPACGVRGERLVLASAEGLARELLGGEARAEAAPDEPADLLVVRARPLAHALEAAMPLMITNQMVEEGKSREQATQDLEAFLAVVRAFESLRAELRYGESETRLHIELAGRKEAL